MRPLKPGQDDTCALSRCIYIKNERQYLVSYHDIDIISIYSSALCVITFSAVISQKTGAALLLRVSRSSPAMSIWTTFVCLSLLTHACTCACVFGTGPTSVLSGNVRPDESQCPLHTLFLPILLCCRGRPKVGEEEGELPAGPVDVLTTVHRVEQCLRAVLCPQAAGSQRGEGRGEQMVCSAGAQPERSIMFGCVWQSRREFAVHSLSQTLAWDCFTLLRSAVHE